MTDKNGNHWNHSNGTSHGNHGILSKKYLLINKYIYLLLIIS